MEGLRALYFWKNCASGATSARSSALKAALPSCARLGAAARGRSGCISELPLAAACAPAHTRLTQPHLPHHAEQHKTPLQILMLSLPQCCTMQRRMRASWQPC